MLKNMFTVYRDADEGLDIGGVDTGVEEPGFRRNRQKVKQAQKNRKSPNRSWTSQRDALNRIPLGLQCVEEQRRLKQLRPLLKLKMP